MQIHDYLRTQIGFSRATFGPGERTEGVLDHIAKECQEVRDEPSLKEWIDLVILAFDGAWRHAMVPGRSVSDTAKMVENALNAKLDENMRREWPDWRTAPKDRAIEHVRNGG